MKRFIVIVFLGFLLQQGMSQVNLETVYQVSGALTQLENSGPKYYVMDWVNVQCRIYNMDHTVWKVINLPVPSGYYLYDIRFVSEKLFDTDDLVELALTYYYYEETGQYYIYGSKIVNEQGEDLVVIPGAAYVDVYDAGTYGKKFLAWVWDYSVYPYPVQTWVYDLPGGSGPNAIHTPSVPSALPDPYPNPAHTFVTIHYDIPDNLTAAEIQFMDLEGRVLKVYPVTGGNESLRLDVSMYPKGVYLYRIVAGNFVSENSRLIVQ